LSRTWRIFGNVCQPHLLVRCEKCFRLSPSESLKATAGPKQWMLHAPVIPLTLERLRAAAPGPSRNSRDRHEASWRYPRAPRYISWPCGLAPWPVRVEIQNSCVAAVRRDRCTVLRDPGNVVSSIKQAYCVTAHLSYVVRPKQSEQRGLSIDSSARQRSCSSGLAHTRRLLL
jgi:hypothetical protein